MYDIESRIAPLNAQLANHRLYELVTDEAALRTFMRAHVFCVWDFQSILSALQQQLTCVSVPWVPGGDPQARRLINEVVLEEESDEHPDGGYISHYEFYLEAMGGAGADTKPIEALIEELKAGKDIDSVINTADLPAGVEQFLATTFGTIASGDVHRIVGLFCYTREEIIPDMFIKLVEYLTRTQPGRWDKFHYYLNRHIEMDGERHGPISQALLKRICGENARKWAEAGESVEQALKARIRLWDAIAATIEAGRQSTQRAVS